MVFRSVHACPSLATHFLITLQDPATTEKLEKSVFVVFFAGERARTKIMKVCDACVCVWGGGVIS